MFLFKEDLKENKYYSFNMLRAVTDFPMMAACSSTALEKEVLIG